MNYLDSLPGESYLNAAAGGDVKIETQGAGKAQYFASGASGWKVPYNTPKEVEKKWKQEYDLCDCSTCYDRDCKCRQKNTRFPADIGGMNQCLRLMQDKTPFVFRLATGLVVELPPEIVQLIREGG